MTAELIPVRHPDGMHGLALIRPTGTTQAGEPVVTVDGVLYVVEEVVSHPTHVCDRCIHNASTGCAQGLCGAGCEVWAESANVSNDPGRRGNVGPGSNHPNRPFKDQQGDG